MVNLQVNLSSSKNREKLSLPHVHLLSPQHWNRAHCKMYDWVSVSLRDQTWAADILRHHEVIKGYGPLLFGINTCTPYTSLSFNIERRWWVRKRQRLLTHDIISHFLAFSSLSLQLCYKTSQYVYKRSYEINPWINKWNNKWNMWVYKITNIYARIIYSRPVAECKSHLSLHYRRNN